MTSGGEILDIRPAGPEAAVLLAALEARSFADPWTRADLEPLFGAGAAAAFLARDAAGAAVGFALFQLLPGEAELLRIGVVPEARRRGAARRLLAAALGALAAGGRPACHLEVRAGNLPACALYERLGFVRVGLRRAYYADGEDALRYARAAPAEPR
jgi:ribosomal-protein-alanine N-acetyltransferase